MTPLKQRCAFGGQDWWDAHACPAMAAQLNPSKVTEFAIGSLQRTYTQAELDAAVAAERERCRLAAHDAVMRALDEAGVRNDALRGMCAEVAMERFSDELGDDGKHS